MLSDTHSSLQECPPGREGAHTRDRREHCMPEAQQCAVAPPGTAPEGSPRDPQATWRSCFSWVCVRVTLMVRAGDEGMRETVQQGWDGWATFKKHFPDRLAEPEDPFRSEGDVDWIAAKDSSSGNGPMVTPITGVGN